MTMEEHLHAIHSEGYLRLRAVDSARSYIKKHPELKDDLLKKYPELRKEFKEKS